MIDAYSIAEGAEGIHHGRTDHEGMAQGQRLRHIVITHSGRGQDIRRVDFVRDFSIDLGHQVAGKQRLLIADLIIQAKRSLITIFTQWEPESGRSTRACSLREFAGNI